jgi:tRNA threonylcarbamoyladenosine biosynthesis protein TsaB
MYGHHPSSQCTSDQELEPLAKNMLPLAEKRIAEQKFEDVAYFVPFYLKDFIATKPRKLL